MLGNGIAHTQIIYLYLVLVYFSTFVLLFPCISTDNLYYLFIAGIAQCIFCYILVNCFNSPPPKQKRLETSSIFLRRPDQTQR